MSDFVHADFCDGEDHIGYPCRERTAHRHSWALDKSNCPVCSPDPVEIDSTLAGGPTEDHAILVTVKSVAESAHDLEQAVREVFEVDSGTVFIPFAGKEALHYVDAGALHDLWFKWAQDYVDAVNDSCPHEPKHQASELVYDLDDCVPCDENDTVNYMLGHCLGMQAAMSVLGLPYELEFPEPRGSRMECSYVPLDQSNWCETHDSPWSSYMVQEVCDKLANK